MKKIMWMIMAAMLAAFPALAAGGDDIVGIWMNENGEAQVQIYREGDHYYGKIIWLKNPNDPKRGGAKTDFNNPDPALRGKPILGLVILRNFTYADGEWSGGRVYDPQNGKDYRCYMKLKDPHTMSMRGYIGVSLLGRTEIWKKIK